MYGVQGKPDIEVIGDDHDIGHAIRDVVLYDESLAVF